MPYQIPEDLAEQFGAAAETWLDSSRSTDPADLPFAQVIAAFEAIGHNMKEWAGAAANLVDPSDFRVGFTAVRETMGERDDDEHEQFYDVWGDHGLPVSFLIGTLGAHAGEIDDIGEYFDPARTDRPVETSADLEADPNAPPYVFEIYPLLVAMTDYLKTKTLPMVVGGFAVTITTIGPSEPKETQAELAGMAKLQPILDDIGRISEATINVDFFDGEVPMNGVPIEEALDNPHTRTLALRRVGAMVALQTIMQAGDDVLPEEGRFVCFKVLMNVAKDLATRIERASAPFVIAGGLMPPPLTSDDLNYVSEYVTWLEQVATDPTLPRPRLGAPAAPPVPDTDTDQTPPDSPPPPDLPPM